jgi:hypothetical protein
MQAAMSAACIDAQSRLAVGQLQAIADELRRRGRSVSRQMVSSMLKTCAARAMRRSKSAQRKAEVVSTRLQNHAQWSPHGLLVEPTTKAENS